MANPDPTTRSQTPGCGVQRAAVLLLLFALVAVGAGAQGIRFSTENDILTDNPTKDDLYSFALGFEVERHGLVWSLRENGFTDRAAGLRFDETFLTVGYFVPKLETWTLFVAGGVAHLGEGIFGERTQNAVHRAIGDDEVHLGYTGSSFHPRFELRAERASGAGPAAWGPRFELESVPGLRSHATVGAQGLWQPSGRVEVHLFAGVRWSDASFAPLEPHLVELAAAARVGVVVDGRFFLSWSYNEYGDEREHLAVGYVVPLGRGRSRD
jgi:hypothetical protein